MQYISTFERIVYTITTILQLIQSTYHALISLCVILLLMHYRDADLILPCVIWIDLKQERILQGFFPAKAWRNFRGAPDDHRDDREGGTVAEPDYLPARGRRPRRSALGGAERRSGEEWRTAQIAGAKWKCFLNFGGAARSYPVVPG